MGRGAATRLPQTPPAGSVTLSGACSAVSSHSAHSISGALPDAAPASRRRVRILPQTMILPALLFAGGDSLQPSIFLYLERVDDGLSVWPNSCSRSVRGRLGLCHNRSSGWRFYSLCWGPCYCWRVITWFPRALESSATIGPPPWKPIETDRWSTRATKFAPRAIRRLSRNTTGHAIRP